MSIGVAAHITAAAPGGPRYDPSLTQEQRESPENGIWLCQNCQIRVDRDTGRYSTELLRNWKSLAESNADLSLGRPFDRSQGLELEILSDISPITNILWTPDVNAYLETLKSTDEQLEVLASGTGLHGQPYVITAVPSNYGWKWVLTFSVAGEFGWEAISRLALEGQKGCTPEATYIPGIPGALSVTHLNGYGTGVFRRSTTWFRIKRGELTSMLSYPYSYYVAGWGMPFGRQLQSQVLRQPEALSDGQTLTLKFSITYGMLDESDEALSNLFAQTATRSLQWSDAAQAFVPSSSADDFALIGVLWSEGTEGFLQRNYHELSALARTGNEKQKSFLHQHFPEVM